MVLEPAVDHIDPWVVLGSWELFERDGNSLCTEVSARDKTEPFRTSSSVCPMGRGGRDELEEPLRTSEYARPGVGCEPGPMFDDSPGLLTSLCFFCVYRIMMAQDGWAGGSNGV
jgi:hypothetical protein